MVAACRTVRRKRPQAFPAAVLQEWCRWGCWSPEGEQGAGLPDGCGEEGGQASPQRPQQSRQQGGAERRNTLQGRPRGPAWSKPWASTGAHVEAVSDKLGLNSASLKDSEGRAGGCGISTAVVTVGAAVAAQAPAASHGLTDELGHSSRAQPGAAGVCLCLRIQ